jgi:hypothetical protein
MPRYDFTIDCAMDFTPDIDVEQKDSTTGELIPYTPLTGVTLLLSAVRGSLTPIHATLSQSATERSSTPGRIYATFDVANLQSHLLPTYEGQVVWLNVYKSGELQYQPFRCLVHGDRLGV